MDSNGKIERQRFNLVATTIGWNGWLSFILCFSNPDVERRLCSQVCKTSPMLWRKGPKKVLNFLLCILEGSKVQNQSLVVGCAPLSLPVPFLYGNIISVMKSLDYLSDMYVLAIELLVEYKRKLDSLYKVIPHGKVFSEFLTKYFVGCLQCH